ncbi:MAG: translocation/assembly module TamB [Sphingobacteriaceae bacterium]|nr:translocation/assembly module TamB [Sphingobacteriaceae bacterium]
MVTLVGILFFTLKFKPVQTFIGQKAAAYLSKELKSTVKIGGLYLDPFKMLVLDDLLILDKQKDTLLSAKNIEANLKYFSLKKNILDVSNLKVSKMSFYLKNYKNDELNLSYILNYFSSEKKTEAEIPFKFNFDKIILDRINFKYKNYKYPDTIQKDINYDDLDIKNLSATFKNLNNNAHWVQGKIISLGLTEKTGFIIKNLTGDAIVDANFIEVKNLFLKTNKSRITNYYKMSFKSYSDFYDYNNKVKMTGVFKNSYVSASDIAHFTTSLDKMKLSVNIDGKASGTVANLRGKNLTVKVGKASYVKGDFILKGLPNLDQTFMDIKVKLASTNKSDIIHVVKGVTENKNLDQVEILDKLGFMNFNGTVKGFWHNFSVNSELKSKLGLVSSNLNLTINKKDHLLTYLGELNAFDFNLSSLVDEEKLGRLSANLTVSGNGLQIKTLTNSFTGNVSYLDFNGYKYQHIKVDGSLNKLLLSSTLIVDDPNIQLNTSGTIDFNNELALYKIKGNIKNTNISALNFLNSPKENQIKNLSLEMNLNFSGDNIENLTGELLAKNISLENKSEKFNFSTIQLNSNNNGITKSLNLKSDLVDANISGKYDLKTIVPFLKNTIKRYIPSLKIETNKHKDQIFTFRLKIKNFEPISKIFIPKLRIPEEAVLIADINSTTNTEIVNGGTQKIFFKNFKAYNVILDQNITEPLLETVLSSEKIFLNDSLYIENVNISNKLRNDSLTFNVKLANENEKNTLDLNGIVDFSSKNIADFYILPSILKVNAEQWHLEDKVNVSIEGDKINIKDFELKNKNQLISVNGLISDDINDVLSIGYKTFDLKTIKPIFNSLGIDATGILNGRTELKGVLGKLKANNNLKIDSLIFNDSYIGNFEDASSFNSQTNLINIYSSVTVNKIQNLNVIGSIDVVQKTLNLNAEFYDLKTSILQPFLNTIVSDISGKMSSNLNILGTFNHPIINGNVSLEEAKFKVNYLKTIYTITDNIEVENSALKLKNLKINDLANNQAIANGTVDLNRIEDVRLNLTLNASKFAALNTTVKDNDLYYGKAFATGIVKFNGPISQLKIDIDAKSEQGTNFNLPLNNSDKISDKEFISFVKKDVKEIKKTDFGGLKMRLKLKVDPNSTINIHTGVGLMTGKGNGDLELNIEGDDKFTMVGDYIIENGNFDFTSQDFINKRFSVKSGGLIKWTGNPMLAQLNLNTLYQLRAVTDDLYAAANRPIENVGQSMLTEVEMNLTGPLTQPNIIFNLNFPNNPDIKERFQAYLNDKNTVTQQAISLIVLRKFSPKIENNSLGNQVQSGFFNTSQEFLGTLANNVISSLNISFLDVNIKSLEDANVSLKLLNNRLIINGGVNGNNARATNSTTGAAKTEIGGEADVSILITKDGKLRANAAHKLPRRENLYSNSGINEKDYVTSVGLSYSQQFDTFKEFLHRLTGKYKRDKKKKELQKKEADKQKNK